MATQSIPPGAFLMPKHDMALNYARPATPKTTDNMGDTLKTEGENQ